MPIVRACPTRHDTWVVLIAAEVDEVLYSIARRVRPEEVNLGHMRTLWDIADEQRWRHPIQLLKRLRTLSTFPDILPAGEATTNLDYIVSVLANRNAHRAAEIWLDPISCELLLTGTMDPSISGARRCDLVALAIRGQQDSAALSGPASEGEILGLLQAVQVTGMAAKQFHVGSVLSLLEGGLPLLREQIDSLTAASAAGIVDSLAQILVWQVRSISAQCFVYIASVLLF